jgi:hypothetical protein
VVWAVEVSASATAAALTWTTKDLYGRDTDAAELDPATTLATV